MSDLTLLGCIITDNQQRILMVHRNTPKRTQWELPGGKADSGQDAWAVAANDMQKELGVQVHVGERLGEKFLNEDGWDMQFQWFRSRITNGEPKPADTSRYDQVGYYSIQQLHERDDLSTAATMFVKQVRDGHIIL